MSPNPTPRAEAFYAIRLQGCNADRGNWYDRNVRTPGMTRDFRKAMKLAARLRVLDCADYDGCLDRMAKLRATGWDCTRCQTWWERRRKETAL